MGIPEALSRPRAFTFESSAETSHAKGLGRTSGRVFGRSETVFAGMAQGPAEGLRLSVTCDSSSVKALDRASGKGLGSPNLQTKMYDPNAGDGLWF